MSNIAKRGRQLIERGNGRKSGLKTAACLAGGLTLFAYLADQGTKTACIGSDVGTNGVTTEQVQPASADKGGSVWPWAIAAGLGFMTTMAGAGRAADSMSVDNHPWRPERSGSSYLKKYR